MTIANGILDASALSDLRAALNAGGAAGLDFPGDRVKRIAILGDSFVGGSGDAPNTFAILLAAALRARYGDAGAGLIPWFDGKAAGFSHSANFLTVGPTGPGTSFYRWDDARKKQMFNGLGYYRDGGVGGTDGDEALTYTPNVADSFSRGVVDTIEAVRVLFSLRSANSGFQIRQTTMGTTVAPGFSSGAAFTGSVTGTTLTASSVAGVIPRAGSRIFGGVMDTTVTIGGGTNSGGAGTHALNTSQTVGSQAMTCDPNISPELNVPQAVTYALNSSFNQSAQVLGCYGDVVVSAIEHYNGNPGVTISDFGVGGALAYQFASLDDAAQRRFWQLANYDLAIVPLGMNDRTYMSPTQFGSDMAKIVSRIQASPRTKVILARQTDSSDAGSSNLQYYDVVLKALAQQFGCGYIDERETSADFATYAAANSAGSEIFTRSPVIVMWSGA